MTEAAGWLVSPSGRWIPWGDSHAEGAPGWALEEGSDDEGLHVFEQSGLAVVKHGRGYLAMTAAFHNTTHKHSDELGFELHDRGVGVISDSGFPGYNIDKWRHFSRSAQAHSVLSVRDWEFPTGKAKFAYGSGLLAAGGGDGWYAIEGHNPLLLQRAVGHRRLFLYRPGRALLVLDRVRSRRSHRYSRLFQLAPGIEATRRGRVIELKGPGFRGGLQEPGRASRRSLVKGRYTPPRGWSFPAVKLRASRWTVAYRARDRNARYLTAIGLQGAARARLLPSKQQRLRLRVGGAALRRSTLSVRRLGDRLVVNRLRARDR